MKHTHALYAVVLFIALNTAGCHLWQKSETPIAAAERQHAAVTHTIHTFLQVVYENEPFVRDNLPEVYALAVELRTPTIGPDGKRVPTFTHLLTTSFDAIQAFKATGGPGEEEEMKDSLARVSETARRARLMLATYYARREKGT